MLEFTAIAKSSPAGCLLSGSMDEKEQIFTSIIEDNDELISQVIAKVVAAI